MKEMLLSVKNCLIKRQTTLFKRFQQEINVRDITIGRFPFYMLARTDTTGQTVYFRTTIATGNGYRLIESDTERLKQAFY